jgi:hypothetical protein
VFSINEQDLIGLRYLSKRGREGGVSGLNPEVYTHEIAGVQQDGLSLGLGNVTTWGFELVLGRGGAESSGFAFIG